MMSDAVIVEDDPFFRKELAHLLTAIPGVEVTGAFSKGEEFLTQVQKLQPAVLFLDVGLPGITGIEVADCVRRDFPYMEIVFITADENHIKAAFHLYASDFITKPLDSDRLHQTMARIIRKLSVLGAKIELNCEEKIEILSQEDIYMVEALAKKTVIYTTIRKFTCLHSMKDMEDRLDKSLFHRTSRSYLVNLKLVEGIKSYTRTSYQIVFKSRDYQAYLQKGLYPEFRKRIKALSGARGGEI
ncbi:LytR/AlgR family response regulator transcription factor [Desulfosporosinus shakirovi]|uniref:LytR/AlgR family response regulator transcription factor n=1 Tax=Desulfosporosinus shakirovi TaxID=2885154 RepID=UPI001E28C8D1|nr:LytTR family DNA-binding domain-containing protein [Desulfosporosinus sp. SRJS8]MCB8817574.1 LytTR family DNA-binding domain-containing protein [Desulfosporosinus sp. SRJS8]